MTAPQSPHDATPPDELAAAPDELVAEDRDAPLLRLRDATVIRHNQAEEIRILDRLNLAIPQGVHTAILGPNGSGKTSLLKLLNRQFYPSVQDGQSGQVEIFGRSRWNVEQLRKRLGIVSGDLDREFSLPRSGRMTALQAVLSGFDGVQLVSFTDQTNAWRRQQAEAALQRVGAAALASRSLMTLSTGERRRVLIARALVHQPKALVLDEPTTGLDIAASTAFLRQLRELAHGGITIILVTHHVEEIFPEIDNVLLLKAGRVFSQGDAASQLNAPQLSALFGIEVQLQRDPGGRLRMTAAP